MTSRINSARKRKNFLFVLFGDDIVVEWSTLESRLEYIHNRYETNFLYFVTIFNAHYSYLSERQSLFVSMA